MTIGITVSWWDWVGWRTKISFPIWCLWTWIISNGKKIKTTCWCWGYCKCGSCSCWTWSWITWINICSIFCKINFIIISIYGNRYYISVCVSCTITRKCRIIDFRIRTTSRRTTNIAITIWLFSYIIICCSSILTNYSNYSPIIYICCFKLSVPFSFVKTYCRLSWCIISSCCFYF